MSNKREEITEVIDNFRRIFQATIKYSKDAERSTRLTAPQLWALKVLGNESPIRVSDLARLMYLTPATVVGIIDRLEEKGLVTRTRSSKDRRSVHLEPTKAGIEIVAKSPEVTQTVLLKGLEELSDKDFNTVIEGMHLIVRILGAEDIPPRPLHG